MLPANAAGGMQALVLSDMDQLPATTFFNRLMASGVTMSE
jgi:hypothetical protein